MCICKQEDFKLGVGGGMAFYMHIIRGIMELMLCVPLGWV